MPFTVRHTKTLSSPDSGAADKVYGADYVAATSHTLVGYSSVYVTSVKSSTTTSTLTNSLPELLFTVSNTINYHFEFGLVLASALSTTGVRIGVSSPTFSTFACNISIPQGTGAPGPSSELYGFIAANASSVMSSSSPANSTQFFALVNGVLVPTANGNMIVTFATEVAGSAISTFAGSYGRLISS